MTSGTPRSVVIVGAGIYGVTAAIEIARRGLDVVVLDPGPLPHPDASSTDISKAVRADYGKDTFYSAMMDEAFEGWEAWNAEWDRPLYHPDGFLLLSTDAIEAGSFEQESMVVLSERQFPIERLDGAKLSQRFPAWSDSAFADGYLNARGGWAESGNVVARLIEIARTHGVSFEVGAAAGEWLESGTSVIGVRTEDGAEHRADVTLLAAGAWTPHLLPALGDVMWVVGQPVLHFAPDRPERFRAPEFPVWSADISRRGWYGFPALPDGRVKVANHGPGRPIHPREPRTVAADDEARFREFLSTAIPDLAVAPLVGSRLCLYCDTWDGDFYIDHVPDRPGLAIATGGSGHGFKFAPVLGSIVADVLLGVPNPYASRFAWRERGERCAEDARCLEP